MRTTVAGNPLVGTFCVLTNQGAYVHPEISVTEMEELGTLLSLPLCSGTINRGTVQVGSGLTANDTTAFCGSETTGAELQVVDAILRVGGAGGEEEEDMFECENREILIEELY